MKKVLSILLSAALVLTLFGGSAYAGNGNGNGNGKDKEKFKDIEEHWGKQSVEKIQDKGILNGYEDGTFQPDRTLTQGELAVILSRLLEVKQLDEDENLDDDELDDEDQDDDEELDDDELSEVPGWAKNAVQKGFQNKYLNMKRFHSQVQCDRLTACVAIAKALDLEPVTDFSTNPFKDMDLISDEDFGYLLALYEAGYINGYPDGNFNPNRLLTRAQIANIIDKLLDDEVISEDENEPTWDNDSYVTASAVKAESVKLKWSAADDNVKVTGYKVICEADGNDDKVKYSADREITIGGLEPEEDYAFTVQARDAAGNWSDDGPSVEVTTLEEEEEEDTEAPEWPDGADLTISSSASGIVTVIWPDATDNVEVKSYKLYLDGELDRTVDGDDNSANVTGLDADTTYTFKLKAVDDAGNESSSLTKDYVTD